MKKIITIVLAGILTVSLLGCSATAPAAEPPAAEPPATEQPQKEETALSPEQSADAPESEAPASSATPDGAQEQDANVQSSTSIFGKVKSIVGNEIELELAKPPFDMGVPEGEGGEMEPGTVTEAAKSITVTVAEGDMPEGAEGDGDTKEGNVIGYEGADGSVQIVGGGGSENKMELEYTGETKNIIIPTGIDILSILTGKTAKLEDIKKGSVLMLSVDDANAERSSAQSVTIME